MEDDVQMFSPPEYVEKIGGDYRFTGVVVAAFQKKSGKWRYVVENDSGLLHIFSGKQLRILAESKVS